MGAMETWTTLLVMLAVTMVTSGQMRGPQDIPEESSLPSCIRAHIQAAFRLEEGHGALVHIPRCDDRLMWQEIQCMDQLGLCWCVNTTTGDRTSAAVVGQPDCSTMAALPRDVDTMPGVPVCPGGRTPTVCAVSTCVRTGCAGAALCRADPCNQCRPVFMRQDGAVITDCQSQGSTCEREMVSIYDDLLRDLSQDHQVYMCTLNRLVLRYTATGLFTGLRLPERNLTILQEVVEHCRACAVRPPPPPWRNNLDDLDESSSEEDSDYTLEDDDDDYDDDTTMEDDEDDDDDSKGMLEKSSETSETSSTESKDDDDDDDSEDDDDDSEDNPMGRPPPGRGPVISRGLGGPVLHREGPPQGPPPGPPPGPPLDDPTELAGLLPVLGMLLRISSADDLLSRIGSRLRSDAGMQKPGFCPMMGATGSMVNCSRGSDATCSGIEKCCPDVSGGMRCVNPKLLTSGLILPKCRPDDDVTHGGYQYKQCFSALMSICACVDPVGNIRPDTIRVGGNLTCGPNGILFEESARRVQCPGNVQPSVCKSACRRQVSCESPPRGGSITCLADMCDCSAVIYAPSRTTDVTRGVLSGHVMDAYLPPSGQLTAMLRRALAFNVRGLLARMSSGPMYPPMGLPNRPSGQRPSRPGQGGRRPPPSGGNGPPAPGASRPPPPGSNSPPNPQRPGTQPGLPGPPAPVGTPGTVNDQQHNPPPLGGNLPDWLLPENFLPRSEQRPDPSIPPSKMEVMRGELALRFFRRGLLLVIKLELFPALEALPVGTLGMDLALIREWVDRLLAADRRGGMGPPEEDDSWTGPMGRSGPPPGGRGPQGRGRGPPGGSGPARGTGARGNHTRGAPSPPGVREPGQGPPPRRGPPRGKGPLLNCTVVSNIPDICSLPAPRRECMQKNNMTVYYYDSNRDTCLPMTGVCKEERHKFRTMSECLQRCAGALCPGQTPRVCPTYRCHLRAFCRALPEAICTVDPCSCEQVFYDPSTRDRVACNDTEAFGLCSRFRASARRENTMMKVLGQCTGPPAPAPPPGWMPPPGQGQPPPGWMPPPGQVQPPPGWMPPPGQGQPPPGWMPPPGQGQPPPGWMPPPGQGQPPPGWTPPPGQRLPPAPAPPPQGGQGRGAGRRAGGGPTPRGMGGVRGSWKELASQARPEDIRCEQNLFSPMQCSQQSCWCVNPVGQSVMGRPQGGSLKCPNHRLRRVDFAIAFNGSINLIGEKDLFMRSIEQSLNTRPGPLRNMMKIVDVISGSIIVVGEIDLRQTQDTNAYLAPLSQMEDEIEAELLVVRHEQLVLVATPGRTIVDLEFVEEVEIIEIENPVPTTSAPTSKPTTSGTDGKGKGGGGGGGKPGEGGHGNDLMDGEQKEEVTPSTMSVGLLVGIIVGGAVLGLLIILTIFMCVRRIKTRSPKDKSAE